MTDDRPPEGSSPGDKALIREKIPESAEKYARGFLVPWAQGLAKEIDRPQAAKQLGELLMTLWWLKEINRVTEGKSNSAAVDVVGLIATLFSMAWRLNDSQWSLIDRRCAEGLDFTDRYTQEHNVAMTQGQT